MSSNLKRISFSQIVADGTYYDKYTVVCPSCNQTSDVSGDVKGEGERTGILLMPCCGRAERVYTVEGESKLGIQENIYPPKSRFRVTCLEDTQFAAPAVRCFKAGSDYDAAPIIQMGETVGYVIWFESIEYKAILLSDFDKYFRKT